MAEPPKGPGPGKPAAPGKPAETAKQADAARAAKAAELARAAQALKEAEAARAAQAAVPGPAPISQRLWGAKAGATCFMRAKTAALQRLSPGRWAGTRGLGLDEP